MLLGWLLGFFILIQGLDLGLELTVYRAVFVCQLGFERDEVLLEAFDG
jgi:hypothetical protein